jgi:hypothetical protein
MFPTARPGLPLTAASIPIASSGALVPRDTTVRPIIIGRMPSHDARPVPARTSTSAPTISADDQRHEPPGNQQPAIHRWWSGPASIR